MATDVEESDTDEHERPAPPKRQCTRLLSSNDSYEANLNQRIKEEEDRQNKDEECEYDEVERLAREKLSIWQQCQEARGLLDNTINRAVENCILHPHVTYPMDDTQCHLFRDTDMEDRAVMMAIRNYGLVHNADMVSRSEMLYSERMTARWSEDEHIDLLHSYPSSRLPARNDLTMGPLPSSSAIFEASRSSEIDRRVGTNCPEDKVDESDREQDFLERAVAEAIKKKGLSALSVDYG